MRSIVVLGLLSCLPISVFGQGSAATSTTLAITSSAGPVTTVPAGTVVTLTATVTAGASPVTTGQVNFCDASVGVYYKNGMAWIASQPYAPRVQRKGVWSMRG